MYMHIYLRMNIYRTLRNKKNKTSQIKGNNQKKTIKQEKENKSFYFSSYKSEEASDRSIFFPHLSRMILATEDL